MPQLFLFHHWLNRENRKGQEFNMCQKGYLQGSVFYLPAHFCIFHVSHEGISFAKILLPCRIYAL